MKVVVSYLVDGFVQPQATEYDVTQGGPHGDGVHVTYDEENGTITSVWAGGYEPVVWIGQRRHDLETQHCVRHIFYATIR